MFASITAPGVQVYCLTDVDTPVCLCVISCVAVPLQMMQSLKALIENADAVYEKIVHCQKAGE